MDPANTLIIACILVPLGLAVVIALMLAVAQTEHHPNGNYLRHPEDE